jgi:hypothetical protein
MFDAYDYNTPEDKEGSHLQNQTCEQDHDDESYESVKSTVMQSDSDDNFDYYIKEDFPLETRDKISGITYTIRVAITFFNPRPQDGWEDQRGETDLFKVSIKRQQGELLPVQSLNISRRKTMSQFTQLLGSSLR